MDTKKNIMLIVDDMELNRAVLNELFYRKYTVMEAEDGKQALAILDTNKAEIAIVLLDIMMPVMNGLEVLAHMKEEGMLQSIPVVMLTSENPGESITKAFQLGAVEAVTKPFHTEIVRNRLERLMAGRFSETICTLQERGAPEQFLRERTLYLLEQERKKHRILAELSGEIIFHYDVSKDYMEFSGKKLKIFDCEECISNYSTYFRDADPVYSVDKVKASRLHESKDGLKSYSSVDIRLRTKEDKYEWFEVQSHVMKHYDGKQENIVYIGKITNIHRQKIEKEKLRLEAKTDTLTGLYNHKAAREIVKCYMEEEKDRAALIFIDVDNFKKVNDHFGHSVGDEVLTNVGNILRQNFRNSDVIARIGGDEFIVFIKGFDSEEKLRARVVGLLNAIGGMNGAKNWDCKVFVSIGVAYFPENGTTYEELFERADKALYLSKDKGKNQITFFESSLEEAGVRTLSEIER